MMFRALLDLEVSPGAESLKMKLVTEAESWRRARLRDGQAARSTISSRIAAAAFHATLRRHKATAEIIGVRLQFKLIMDFRDAKIAALIGV